MKTIENINDIIVGKEVDMEKTLAQHAMYFKYALVTSVEDIDIIMFVVEDNWCYWASRDYLSKQKMLKGIIFFINLHNLFVAVFPYLVII